MTLQRNRSRRGRRHEVRVGLDELRRMDDHKRRCMHLICVRVFDRRAGVVIVLVLVRTVGMIRVIAMVVVTVTVMIGLGGADFGESQLGGAVPGMIVVDMLTAESHGRGDHARHRGEHKSQGQNEDCEPTHRTHYKAETTQRNHAVVTPSTPRGREALETCHNRDRAGLPRRGEVAYSSRRSIKTRAGI